MKVLCIDIGGTFLKHTVIDERQKIGDVGKAPTPRDGLENFLSAIQGIYKQYQEISGIAISAPGIIDTERGFMITGGSIEYIQDIPMAERISELCDQLPVYIENDAKAAATAELYSGVLKNVKNGVVLTFGTAIGGTVIVNRKVLRGSNLFAGEVSYAIYHDDGTRDGEKWNIETNMWGCRGIPAQIVRNYGNEELRCEDILERLACGDDKADASVRIAARDVARLAHNLQCVFDPDIIAVGGGVSVQKDYIRLLREESEKLNAVFHGVVPNPRIEPCKYFNDANLLGAYYAFQNHVNELKLNISDKKELTA